jgi:periplasmic copper chaperone A
MKTFRTPTLTMVAALLSATPAFAHATLDRGDAPADSYFQLAINIPHGCEGSPTLKVRVRIPDDVVGVKPQPKPGWDLAIRKVIRAPATGPSRGHDIGETVAEVTWTGKLLDEHFDRFVLHMRLPDRPGATLYFHTVQECEKGVHRWIELPGPGKSAGDLKEPAPALRLGPKGQRH